MKRYATSLINTGKQIKTTVGYRSTPIMIFKNKTKQNRMIMPNSSEDAEWVKCWYIAGTTAKCGRFFSQLFGNFLYSLTYTYHIAQQS